MYEDPNNMTTESAREKLKRTIMVVLGGTMSDVELDDDQLETAIDMTIENYRTRSGNAYEEAFLQLKMLRDESSYVLPREVSIVRKIYRRGNGVVNGSGSTTDPFSIAYTNTYLLSAVRGSSGGGLLTYDLYHQFDEVVGRMFGRDIMFTFNRVTKRLVLERTILGDEDVLLHVYQMKPEFMLYQDNLIYPWIRDWAIATAKHMLGRVRSKFQSLGGPQGSITLDGSALLAEAAADFERLEKDIRNYRDGAKPMGFIIG